MKRLKFDIITIITISLLAVMTSICGMIYSTMSGEVMLFVISYAGLLFWAYVIAFCIVKLVFIEEDI